MTTVSMPRRLPKQKLFRCPACSKMPEAAMTVYFEGVACNVILCAEHAAMLVSTLERGVSPGDA